MSSFFRVLLTCVVLSVFLPVRSADIHEGNWLSWRGPLQTGVSLESYEKFEFGTEPVWSDAISGQGTPVVFNGRLYSWGYRGSGPDLVEVVQARDEKTGEILWERETSDFLSDTVYNRYTIGSVGIDPETENVIAATTYGLVTCYTKDGNIVWEVSMMERYGRLTFPNGRAGAPVIDGDICIIRGVTSYWGADGPAKDRFFGFDKNTGELLWSSSPGIGSPFLKDTSMSTPFLETRDGKRVFYSGTGCGNIVCVNVLDGTPLWRWHVSKGGINSSPVLFEDSIINIHGAENFDTTETGRIFRIKIPDDLDATGGEVDPSQGGAPAIGAEAEVWRQTLEMFTSSPLLHDGKVYQFDKTGMLYCLDASGGEILWSEKLATSQLHASPALVEGRLLVPTYPGDFYVIDVREDKPVIEHKLKLDGNAIGSPAICNGRVYVHTTEKLYAFQLTSGEVTYGAAPIHEMPVASDPTKLSAVPVDVLLRSGDSADISLRSLDAGGVPVADVDQATWEKFVPPTAKVKAEMDASFEGNTISSAADAKLSAGAWKATSGDLSGILRGRVIADLPYTEDFEGFNLVDQPGGSEPGRSFDFPPLPWIGARLKWEVIEHEGNKVLSKTLDKVLFQRSLSFIGHPELSGYTVQADVMTDGNRRIKSVVGVINQRYIISLVGNSNQLEVSSNFERLAESVPFPIAANTWYTLKTRVDVAEDGSGVVRAKAWAKGEAEPDAWTIEVPHKNAHKKGAPGIFGFAPQSQKTVFVDNISITPNN